MSRKILTHWSELDAARIEALMLAAGAIAVFDRELSRLALGSPSIDQLLRCFLSSTPRASLRIALHDTNRALAAQPRLGELLKRFGHQVSVREIPGALRQLPDEMLIVDDSHAVIHFQFDQPRAKLLVDEADEVQPYVRRFDELWEECDPPVSATQLGL